MADDKVVRVAKVLSKVGVGRRSDGTGVVSVIVTDEATGIGMLTFWEPERARLLARALLGMADVAAGTDSPEARALATSLVEKTQAAIQDESAVQDAIGTILSKGHAGNA